MYFISNKMSPRIVLNQFLLKCSRSSLACSSSGFKKANLLGLFDGSSSSEFTALLLAKSCLPPSPSSLLLSQQQQLHHYHRHPHRGHGVATVAGNPLFCAQRRFYCDEAKEEGDEEDVDAEPSSQIPAEKAYNPVDVETSIRYMDSDAYHETYGVTPVWYHYRPNHKFGKPKRITRKTCVIGGSYAFGNPCPICRDNHLVLDYRNVKLLEQFLTPNGLTVYIPYRTQICMKQNKKLLIALEKAKEAGLIEDKSLQFRSYDYSLYYKSLSDDKQLAPVDDSYKNTFAYKVLNKACSSAE